VTTISKFYLLDAASPNGGTLPGSLQAIRVGHSGSASDGDATGARTARDAIDAHGSSNPDIDTTITSLANTITQSWGHRRFVSRPLAAQTIANGGTWTFSYARSESNTAHNQAIQCTVYVWRPSTGAQVGTGECSFAGTEPASASTETAESITANWLTAVTLQDGDVLVFDIATNFVQSMSTSYTESFSYNGTTDASATTCASFVTPPSALTTLDWNQEHFRFRNDDGSESAATWIAAVDTNITNQAANVGFRLRIAFATFGKSASWNPRLQFQVNSGTWTDVGAASAGTAVEMVSSTNLTDESATTQQISSGDGNTFAAGKQETAGTGGETSYSTGLSTVLENEYSIQIIPANGVSGGDTINFRLVDNLGSAKVLYSQTPSLTVAVSSTPKSGTDANGSTTEAQTLVITASDVNGTITESIGSRTATLPDTNSADTEVAAIGEVATDVNAGVTESAAIVVPVAGSDVDGTITEVAAIRLVATDTNGTVTESATVVVTSFSTSDVNAGIIDVAAIRVAGSDVNSATTEATSQVAQIPATDTNTAEDETSTNIRQVTTDANSTTTENGSLGSQAISGTDANGTLTEITNLVLTTTDVNASDTETAALRLSATDVNSGETETAAPTVPITSSDANTGETEITSLVLTTGDVGSDTESGSNTASQISASDVDGALAENSQPNMRVPDANSTTTESGVISAEQITSTDSNSVSTEAAAMKYTVIDSNGADFENGSTNTPLSGTDANGVATESASLVATGLTSSDAGSDTESGSVSTTASSSDTGSSSDLASLVAKPVGTDSGSESENYTLIYVPVSSDSGHDSEINTLVIATNDFSTSTETASFAASLVSSDTGSITETVILITSGMIAANAPHWLLGASMAQAKLFEVALTKPELLSGSNEPAILKRAVKSWRP
jgi:hypothetical protein